MTAVLMIGGSEQLVDAVPLLRAAGYRVIVSDRRADAPALERADEAWVVDATDHDELARRARATADLACTFTLTELVEAVAVVQAAAGLEGPPLDAVARSQDKGLAKDAWLRSGVATPRGTTVEAQSPRALETLDVLFDALETDALFLKPARGFGARGAGRLVRSEDAGRAFAEAARASADGRVVVEEALEGSMHDYNGLFEGGRLRTLGISDRHFHPEHPVEVEAWAPTSLVAAEVRAARELVEAAALALGIVRGPVKADLVRTERGLSVLEIAARLHGPKSSLGLLPAALGRPPLLELVQRATGAPAPNPPAPRAPRVARYRALLPAPGRLSRIAGLEEARALPGVERVWLWSRPGDAVGPYRDNTRVPGYVLAAGATPDAVEATLDHALATLVLETE